MLQGHFGLDQSLQGVLRLHQPLLELMDGVLDLSHLTHKSKRKKKKEKRSSSLREKERSVGKLLTLRKHAIKRHFEAVKSFVI